MNKVDAVMNLTRIIDEICEFCADNDDCEGNDCMRKETVEFAIQTIIQDSGHTYITTTPNKTSPDWYKVTCDKTTTGTVDID